MMFIILDWINPKARGNRRLIVDKLQAVVITQYKGDVLEMIQEMCIIKSCLKEK